MSSAHEHILRCTPELPVGSARIRDQKWFVEHLSELTVLMRVKALRAYMSYATAKKVEDFADTDRVYFHTHPMLSPIYPTHPLTHFFMKLPSVEATREKLAYPRYSSQLPQMPSEIAAAIAMLEKEGYTVTPNTRLTVTYDKEN